MKENLHVISTCSPLLPVHDSEDGTGTTSVEGEHEYTPLELKSLRF